MSPAFWSGGIQGIPDKNDILDIMMHVRRAGPNTTDSLWMFGGISIVNTTGNRYFDFEMYQTDINYDRVSQKWYGYGPDAGHTSWKFNAAGKYYFVQVILFSTGNFKVPMCYQALKPGYGSKKQTGKQSRQLLLTGAASLTAMVPVPSMVTQVYNQKCGNILYRFGYSKYYMDRSIWSCVAG